MKQVTRATVPVLKKAEVTPDQLELARDLVKRRLWAAIRRAIKAGEVSQADLARALGVRPSTISRMLKHPSNLTVSRASDLARVSGHFLSVNIEAVDFTDNSLALRDATSCNFFEYQHNQPGNQWTFRFERSDEKPIPSLSAAPSYITNSANTAFTVRKPKVFLNVD